MIYTRIETKDSRSSCHWWKTTQKAAEKMIVAENDHPAWPMAVSMSWKTEMSQGHLLLCCY